MIETQMKALTAAITRLADLMEASPPVEIEPVIIETLIETITPEQLETVPDEGVADEGTADEGTADEDILELDTITNLRQTAQDLCLSLVRADRSNKPLIAEWLSNCNGAKTIKQVDDSRINDFVSFLESFEGGK